MLVICELLGVRYEDREMFKESAERMMMTSTTEAESMELITKVHAYFGELAELRKREPGDDVFSALVERMEAGDITLDHVKSLAVVLVIAGHDTTVNMIAMSTLALFDNPEQLAELRANTEDPVLVANAVEEMLRYLTLTHIGRRRAIIEDIEIDGKVMRKGGGCHLRRERGEPGPGRVPPIPSRSTSTRSRHANTCLRLRGGAPVHRPAVGPLRAAGGLQHAASPHSDAAVRGKLAGFPPLQG